MRSRIAVVVAVLLGTVLGGSAALRPNGPGVVAGYTYRAGLHLYAHYDPHRTDAPWVLDVHGGSWRFGSGRDPAISQWAEHERSRGFQVFALDYRLSSQARWPAQIDDTRAAADWIRAHATRFGLNPHLGVVVGASAGGQIAAVAALRGGFVGAVVFAGAVDPVAALAAPSPALRTAARDLLGCPPDRCPARWRSAQAQTYIGAHTPPLLIVHAVHDPLVPVGMARAFYRRLRAAGRPAELSVIPGDQHSCQNLPGVVNSTDAFLDRVTRRPVR